MNMRIIIVVICTVVLDAITAQRTEPLTPDITNDCNGKKSCGECLEAGPNCAFCTLPGYDEQNLDRCDLREKHVGCPKDNLMYPQSVLSKTIDNAVMDGDTGVDAIQIQPQEIRLKMRANDPQKFSMTFRLAENYPVDLYYLMDLSNSMKDDKENLAQLGNMIAAEMKTITKNFKLGFGSFVDKTVMPYVSTAPNKLVSPCTGCAPPYGFKNQLKLDINTSLFATEVRRAQVSGNLDSPEGGFDAIMQTIACDSDIGWRSKSRRMLVYSTDAGFHIAGDGKSEIGWRNQSRRMVLFSTDAGFHFAGDGKLGGIVKPNDGRCHLSGGIYTQSKYQDYPSVSQIAAKIKEKNVNIIFAVTEDQVPVYTELSKFIAGSETGKLANDSSNIVQLVRSNYELITSKVEMVTSKAENVTVRFFSKCKGNVTKETNVCEKLNIGDSVTFDVEVEVTNCPSVTSKNRRTLEISPVGLNDKLVIDLSLLCQCNCEREGQTKANSSACKFQGTGVCGTCECNKGFYGKNCECNSGNVTSEQKEAECYMNKTGLKCSNRGECECGQCICNPRRSNSAQKYSGKYCECDNYICPYSEGKLCGGVSHGRCECGVCNCTDNYTGDACDCPTSNATCMAKGDAPGGLCNGEGDCVCGKCRCKEGSQFRGPTCEDCQDCNEVCRANKPCVQCKVHQTGPYDKNECDRRGCKKEGFITEQDVLEEGYKTCEFKDEDDCIFYFSYEYDEKNDLKINAQRTKDCPPQVNVLAIVLGVIAGIVLVGLALLLIWKLVTTISDKRELARFEREAQNAKWDTGENPIYKQATSTFKNPTYAGK